jgi:pimeloyl-ACP methyl ester carboxylesterase
VNDGVQVLTYLIANVNGIDPSKIYLIGHSEGGWTISAMYPLLIKNNIKPKGMMFLCGFGTSMNESLRYQVEQGIISVQKMTGIKGWLYRLLGVDQMIKSQFEANMKYVLSTTSDIVRIMFFYKLNAKWYREIIQYDPIPDWEQIDCDVLAIAGVKDVQVPILNIETIKNLVPNAASVTAMNIENMNHILKTQEGEPSIMNVMTDYKNVVEKEWAPELIHSIQNFLKNE